MEHLGLAFVVCACIPASSKKWERSRLWVVTRDCSSNNEASAPEEIYLSVPLSKLVGKTLSAQNPEGRQPIKKNLRTPVGYVKNESNGPQTSKEKVAAFSNS